MVDRLSYLIDLDKIGPRIARESWTPGAPGAFQVSPRETRRRRERKTSALERHLLPLLASSGTSTPTKHHQLRPPSLCTYIRLLSLLI